MVTAAWSYSGNRITPNQHALVKEFVLLDNFYVDAESKHGWA